MPIVTPGQAAPELSLDTLSGDRFVLADRDPERFTMVVFYRGLHCPVCRKYIGQLDGLVDEFRERGVEVIAVSGDDADRAAEAKEEWDLGSLDIGYGLSQESMAEWGLYISSGLLDDEPDLFSEPGLFLVDADNVVFYAAFSSMPFGRPPLDEMLGGIDFVIENDFPARGIVDRVSA